jgi:hypothetical protein
MVSSSQSHDHNLSSSGITHSNSIHLDSELNNVLESDPLGFHGVSNRHFKDEYDGS